MESAGDITTKEAPTAPALPFPFGEPPSLRDLEPIAPAELRAFICAGENDSDACEWVLAQVARIEGALDLAIGDGLALLARGLDLAVLGFSCVKDYAREVLDLGQRHAQALAHLSRELESRPLLRAAVRAGQVRIRHAQTVLPVATGDAEAAWTEAARHLTVRALEAAVKKARSGPLDEDDEWLRFRVRLADTDRAVVDEAFEIAGRLVPGSRRHERLEMMAMEFLGGHALIDDLVDERRKDRRLCGAFDNGQRQTEREARLERETSCWCYLEPAVGAAVPDLGLDDVSTPGEIDSRLRALAALRARWDVLLGCLCYLVQRSGLWKLAGFATFEHYARERLGLSARAIEQRARLETLLCKKPALRAARDAGLSYERLRVLSRLPDREIPAWVDRARRLTVVALRAAVDERDEGQMRASRVLRSFVPTRVATLLDAAIRAVREMVGGLLDSGRCLVRVAQHFIETWKEHVRRSRTRSQRVRERDLDRCQVPGCSRRGVHAHHVEFRSHGGDDEDENLVALCAFHHLVGIHCGFMSVSGEAPDGLRWMLLRGPRGPKPFHGGAPGAGEEGVAMA